MYKEAYFKMLHIYYWQGRGGHYESFAFLLLTFKVVICKILASFILATLHLTPQRSLVNQILRPLWTASFYRFSLWICLQKRVRSASVAVMDQFVLFLAILVAEAMAISVCQLVGPPLWSRLRYYWMDCREL